MGEPISKTQAFHQRIDDAMWLEAEDILIETLGRHRAPAVTIEALKDELVNVWHRRVDFDLRLVAERILKRTLHRMRPTTETVKEMADRLKVIWDHNTPRRIRRGIHTNQGGSYKVD